MAKGSWDDFTNKYGFNDGEALEDRDFAARGYLTEFLNDTSLFKARGIRAVAYDRPGFHNACLVILLPNPAGRGDAELLTEWLANQLRELPDGIVNEMTESDPDWDINDLIGQAYVMADAEPRQPNTQGGDHGGNQP